MQYIEHNNSNKYHTSLNLICTAAFCRFRNKSTVQVVEMELFVRIIILNNFFINSNLFSEMKKILENQTIQQYCFDRQINRKNRTQFIR